MGKLITAFPQIGILECFRQNDFEQVESAVSNLKQLGIKDLKTRVSWADYSCPDGQKWYDWLIPHLAEEFNVLPCFLHTPPSLGIVPSIFSPPRDPKDFADFIGLFLERHGSYFDFIELWNEPNNRNEYDYTLDESWKIFSSMIILAAGRARQSGKKIVLGGISPIDPGFIKKMGESKVLDHIDIAGIHGFPDVFDSNWRSWQESIDAIQHALDLYNSKAGIWITETGYSTWRYDEKKQVEKFIKVLDTPVAHVYWNSLTDIPFNNPASVGRHIDEREYHFGMIHEDKTPKLLFRLWASGGIKNVVKNQWMATYKPPEPGQKNNPVLITGGAGFIGTNLAIRLLNSGHTVYIYDNLSRPGVENNLNWLKSQYKKNLNIIIADIRDRFAIEEAVQKVSHIFHLAAQVAVTTSLNNPAHDYSVNVTGTLNLLEAIRKSEHRPSLIFTSTNKVYGNLSDVSILKNTTRYFPADKQLKQLGISELIRLDFQSPYGSSKGSADQYILDYARSFDLNNVVFRMSCIYGEHQFGTSDQGWVAHFILKALKDEKIILYGDGMQVRDVLFVEDLVEAFILAWQNIGKLRGEVFNMGGGPQNSISLLELINLLEKLLGRPVRTSFDEWRKGDQKYYISDTSKFSKATGWKPAISAQEGIQILLKWIDSYYHFNVLHKPVMEELQK